MVGTTSLTAEYNISGPGHDSSGSSSSSGPPEAADSLFCRLLAETRATNAAVALPVGVASLTVCCLVVEAIVKLQPHNPGNYILVSMACSGILHALEQLLVAAVNLFDQFFLFYHSSENICLARIALSHTAYFSSITNVDLIAVGHYLFLVQPLIYYRLITKRNTLAIIAFVWMSSIVYGSLAFGVTEQSRYSCCVVTEVVPRFYDVHIPLGQCALSLMVCTLVYGTIAHVSLRLRHIDKLERRRLSKGWAGSDDSSDGRSASWRTRRRRLLQLLGNLRSFSLFLAVMTFVLGLWGLHFLGRLSIELSVSSSTFGAHEEKEWRLTVISSCTVLLCVMNAFINTEVRKAVTILVLRRLGRRLRKRLYDDDAWLDLSGSQHQLSDEARMFHALQCATHVAAARSGVREPGTPCGSTAGRSSGAITQLGLLHPVLEDSDGVSLAAGPGGERPAAEVVEVVGEGPAPKLVVAAVEAEPGPELRRRPQSPLALAASGQQLDLGSARPLPRPDCQEPPLSEGDALIKSHSLSLQVGDHCHHTDQGGQLGHQLDLADEKENLVLNSAKSPSVASDVIVVHFSPTNST